MATPDILRVGAGLYTSVLILNSLSASNFLTFLYVQTLFGVLVQPLVYGFDRYTISLLASRRAVPESMQAVLDFRCTLGIVSGLIFLLLGFVSNLSFSYFIIMGLNFLLIPLQLQKLVWFHKERYGLYVKSMAFLHAFQIVAISFAAIFSPSVMTFLIIGVLENSVLLIAHAFLAKHRFTLHSLQLNAPKLRSLKLWTANVYAAVFFESIYSSLVIRQALYLPMEAERKEALAVAIRLFEAVLNLAQNLLTVVFVRLTLERSTFNEWTGFAVKLTLATVLVTVALLSVQEHLIMLVYIAASEFTFSAFGALVWLAPVMILAKYLTDTAIAMKAPNLCLAFYLCVAVTYTLQFPAFYWQQGDAFLYLFSGLSAGILIFSTFGLKRYHALFNRK